MATTTFNNTTSQDMVVDEIADLEAGNCQYDKPTFPRADEKLEEELSTSFIYGEYEKFVAAYNKCYPPTEFYNDSLIAIAVNNMLKSFSAEKKRATILTFLQEKITPFENIIKTNFRGYESNNPVTLQFVKRIYSADTAGNLRTAKGPLTQHDLNRILYTGTEIHLSLPNGKKYVQSTKDVFITIRMIASFWKTIVEKRETFGGLIYLGDKPGHAKNEYQLLYT